MANEMAESKLIDMRTGKNTQHDLISLLRKSKNVVAFYNKRGTVEQWIKEGKQAINRTRLSCHDFDDNQVRFQLFGLGKIGNL